jgi:HD-GYP domain-containing protein (c-di-GMP phosphodiesterase class II)
MRESRPLEAQLARLNEIGIALSSERNYDTLLTKILQEARDFTRAEAGTLYCIEGKGLRIVAAQNERLAQPEEGRCPLVFGPDNRVPLTLDSMAGYVGITGEVVNLDNAYRIPDGHPYRFNAGYDQRNHYRSQSMLLVPLTEPDGATLGVLQLINARDADGTIIPFDPQWEGLVKSLASQAAVTLRNARLTRQLKAAYSDTIFRLSVAAEYKDEDTANHIHRMAHYSALIAQALGFPHDRTEMLLYAAPMHDVGKIGIRESILQKPGKLTPDEYEEMKQHTILGARIFEGSQVPVLQLSATIALTHHERLDGTGYPRGLRGDEIPIEGKIVALADVFDALASQRCYKPAYPLDKCLRILEEERGRAFDAELVNAFVSRLDDVLTIRDHYSSDSDDGAAESQQAAGVQA